MGTGCNKSLPKITSGMFHACPHCNGCGFYGIYSRGLGQHPLQIDRLSDEEWDKVKGRKYDPLFTQTN